MKRNKPNTRFWDARAHVAPTIPLVTPEFKPINIDRLLAAAEAAKIDQGVIVVGIMGGVGVWMQDVGWVPVNVFEWEHQFAGRIPATPVGTAKVIPHLIFVSGPHRGQMLSYPITEQEATMACRADSLARLVPSMELQFQEMLAGSGR
jgi:hypothetical protein